MTTRRWLVLMAFAGVGIFALSFVNAWIIHDREVRGEGYRHAVYWLSAWRGVGMPVLTIGALAALGAGLAAVAELLGRFRAPRFLLVLSSALALGLIASAALPVAQDGHASSVDLSWGPLLPVGLVLAVALVVAAGVVSRPGRGLVALAALVVVAGLAGGGAGRWVGLQAAEGSGRHWSEGSYTRQAIDGQPTETLTIADARVTIGERWAGSWEWSGWTVVIAGDPACPDARGTYHAHGVGQEDLRFVMVVDPCRDGERASDLQAGTWERDP